MAVVKSKKIAWAQLDSIGQLADKADNFLQYAHGAFADRVPTATRFDALKVGLTELRDDLKNIVIEVSGENPWGDSPASGGTEHG